MVSNTPKLNDATGKISGWAEKLSAAKQTLFKQPEELNNVFAKELLRDMSRVNEVDAAGQTPDMVTKDKSSSRHKDEDRTAFLNNRVKDKILEKWELQGENGPNDDFTGSITANDIEGPKPYLPPLMVGFDVYTDYVELEYMAVSDPVTGKSVAPVVDVIPSVDGKSGVILLNGKTVASVSGGQNMKRSDVKLVRIEVEPSEV